MGRIIVVTSGKGGVGKTTVVANLGISLAKRDKKVIVIDGDIGLNNLDTALSVENKIIYDIYDVISGRCRLHEALICSDYHANLSILCSTHSVNITKQSFFEVLKEAKEYCDYLLVDCPAGIDNGFSRSVFGVCEAIIIATPHICSIRDADKVIRMLSSEGVTNNYLVVNRYRSDLVRKGKSISEYEIANLLHIPLLGTIEEDDDISYLGNIGEVYNKKAENDFDGIATNILGEVVSKRDEGLLDRIMSFVRRKKYE